MLQVRNLPDDVHAKLKQRAVDARMSLSDYVANQLAELVRYRTNAEILEGARLRLAGKSWDETAAESVRAVRAERE